MAIWLRTLDITDVWDTETPSNIAKVIASRLESMKDFGTPTIDSIKKDLIQGFLYLADNPASADDFDVVMEKLYDWADGYYLHPIKNSFAKICWIKTF